MMVCHLFLMALVYSFYKITHKIPITEENMKNMYVCMYIYVCITDAHCQGNTVDIFKFGGCEDNVDIQVLQCFHPTVFVTTQSLLTMDIFDSIPDSTNERQGDDILRTHTLPPDSIEYEDHSIQNVLSIVLGLFILVIYAI